MTLLVQSSVTLENFEDRGLQIHGVVVNKLVAICNQVFGLFNRLLNTIILDQLIIVLYCFQSLNNLRWHNCFGKFTHSFKAIITKNWHHSRNNGHVDACVLTVSNPFVKHSVVIEELSDY